MGVFKTAKGVAKVARVANDIRKGDTGSTEAATRDILHGAVDIATGMIPGGGLARRAFGGHIDRAVDAGAGRIADGVAGAVPGIVEGIRGRAFREGHGGPAPTPTWDDPFADNSISATTSSSSSRSTGDWDWADPAPTPAAPVADRGRGGVFARLRREKESKQQTGLPQSSSGDPYADPFGDNFRW